MEGEAAAGNATPSVVMAPAAFGSLLEIVSASMLTYESKCILARPPGDL